MFVSDPRMVVEEVLLSLLVLLLSMVLSLPNLRLLRYIFTTDQHPNVFDRGLALCLVTSGTGFFWYDTLHDNCLGEMFGHIIELTIDLKNLFWFYN